MSEVVGGVGVGRDDRARVQRSLELAFGVDPGFPDAREGHDVVVRAVNIVGLLSARRRLPLVEPIGRDERAPVTEGDVKRAMLSGGWREDRVQALSQDSIALRFRRRR